MMDRGVSTTLNYVLALAVVAILISGLFIAGNDVVEDQREQAIHSELTVLGNQIAADLSSLDRLAFAGDGTARLQTNLPDTVAGKSYFIDIEDTPTQDRYEITLSTDSPSVDVTVVVRMETTLVATEIGGGDLVFVYDGSDIEVQHA